MEVDVLGIDLAKLVFQLHGATRTGVVVHRSKVSRPSFLESIRRLSPKLVVMEACSSAHHWARVLQRQGIEVRLISPQYVAPFVKTNKNDRNDAEAIVEAASRPSMRFVSIKTVEQQDLQALHRLRQLLVQQRTAIINQVRGVLAERGIVVAQSPTAFHRAMPTVLAGQDDATATVSAPFPLRFFGAPVPSATPLYVSSNGFVSFVAFESENTFGTIPTAAAPNGLIAAYWADLVMGSNGVCAVAVGSAPSRRFILQWSNGQFYSGNTAMPLAGSVSFEIIYNESDASIDFLYDTITGQPAGAPTRAAVGVENLAGMGLAICPGGRTGVAPECTAVMSGTRFRLIPSP